MAAEKVDIKPGDKGDKAAIRQVSRDLLDVVDNVAHQDGNDATVVDMDEQRKRRSAES